MNFYKGGNFNGGVFSINPSLIPSRGNYPSGGVLRLMGKTRDISMAERIKPETAFSVEEILRTEVMVNQALIDILITKQIFSEEDLIAGRRKIRQEQQELILKSGKILTLQK